MIKRLRWVPVKAVVRCELALARGCAAILACTLVCSSLLPGDRADAQSVSSSFSQIACEASGDEFLLIEQVEQLRKAGAYVEAAGAILNRLDSLDAFPVTELPVVKAGRPQLASTLSVQRYVPIDAVFATSLARCLAGGGDQVGQVAQDLSRRSATNLRAQARRRNAAQLRFDVARFGGLAGGFRHSLLAADAALEAGQPLIAMQYLDRIAPEMRYVLPEINTANRTEADGDPVFLVNHSLHQLLVPKLLASLGIASSKVTSNDVQWAKALDSANSGLSEQVAYRMECCGELAAGSQTSTDAPAETDFRWPDRSEQLRPMWSTAEKSPASRPRMGQRGGAALPYHPVVFGESVWVNEITRISRYSLQGAVTEKSQQVVYDSRVSPEGVADAKYPVVGTPRVGLTIEPPVIYARIGGIVTSRIDEDLLSQRLPRTQLVALDVADSSAPRQLFSIASGDLPIDGDRERTEFEGPPVVFDDLVMLPIVERSNVGVSRRVVALDRYSGRLRWQSQILGQGIIPGTERASHIGFQQLHVAGGLLFYSTNLGTVCCLNPVDGSLQWVVQYASPSMALPGGDRERPLRFLYREAGCHVKDGILFCAPSDCGEIFALDVTSGDLVWSTAASELPDIKTLVGIEGDSIIYSGDRLCWVNRWTGRVQAVFPGAKTPGRLTALPPGRSLGQPALNGSRIFYPASQEILVFAAQADIGLDEKGSDLDSLESDRPARIPEPIARIATGNRGLAGGNLIVNDRLLLMASPSRLHIFRRN